jgi:4-hydroxy-tetrahydrodipicolinate synthase
MPWSPSDQWFVRPSPAAARAAARTSRRYQWFKPSFHLDARPDLGQCIKLCEHIMGRGTHRTRPPRLPLDATEAAAIEAMMKHALATRPKLPDVGLKEAA